MNKNDINISNVERFSGFADIYDTHRPEPPLTVVDILLRYLQRKPAFVVDIGSGTGLSTFIWKDYADKALGIEPNQDMLSIAKQKLISRKDVTNVFFEPGVSNNLKLESNSVDIVTCSQAFHWMEPISTLEEVSRVLVDGGIFAAYDNDWPPTADWIVENEYIKLLTKVIEILEIQPNQEKVKHWDKEKHLQRIQESSKFRYVKEIVFHNKERCDADRYVGLALSQGALQSVLKKGISELDRDIENFREIVKKRFDGKKHEIIFSYRMRLGIK